MKNVAIMTYHDMVNYGSFYQMLALQEMVKKAGCNVEIINYKPNTNYLKKIVNNSEILRHMWLIARNNKLWLEFNRCYDNKITKTKVVSSIEDLKKLNNNFDIFIAGSDQIWSPNHFDIHYFLDFVDDKSRRISYAPSVVIDSFTSNQIKAIKKELMLFDYISVREKTSCNIIKKNFKIEPEVVLDPTLAISKDFYNSIKPKSNYCYENDILCYFLGDNDYSSGVNSVSKKFNYKNNINICLNNKINGEIINLNDVNPFDFLSYLKKSKIILTDSFHGVALSIKLNKQFIYFDRFKNDDPICQNSRINDLLNLLSIKNVSYADFINGEYHFIDYNKINAILSKEMKKSIEYLYSSIRGDHRENN